jgi:hypothetical protein
MSESPPLNQGPFSFPKVCQASLRKGKVKKMHHSLLRRIVDIVGILTDQPSVERARNYWKVLKSRLLKEGNEPVTNCNRLKMLSEDGKMRETDVGNVDQIFRIVQSIPSPKAEPFKQWLAKVGYERLQEIQDPSLSMDRARENWKKKGRSEKWIQQRMTGQETRNNRKIYAIT